MYKAEIGHVNSMMIGTTQIMLHNETIGQTKKKNKLACLLILLLQLIDNMFLLVLL